MENNNPEQGSFYWKVIIYFIGLVLGIASKLATLNEQKSLSWSKTFLHASVAFAAAWAMWFFLEARGMSNIAPVASVIIGRYGDNMLLAIWKNLKKLIFSETKDVEAE